MSFFEFAGVLFILYANEALKKGRRFQGAGGGSFFMPDSN